MDYSTKTQKELVSLCKEKGLKGYSGKKKNELIALLGLDATTTAIQTPTTTTTTTAYKTNEFYVGDNLELLR